MPRITEEHRSTTYGTLNLYERLVKLCRAVMDRRVIATEADNLYVYHELRDVLLDLITQINPRLPTKIRRNVLPETISGINEKQYLRLQTGFAPIKVYAKSIRAHESSIASDIQEYIDLADTVLEGNTIPLKVRLSESSIGNYDVNTQTVTINDHPITFSGDQEHYFIWAMFQQPSNQRISWDVVEEAITVEFNDAQVYKQRQSSMYQAMCRINRQVKKIVGTEDNLFSYKRRGFIRNFGP